MDNNLSPEEVWEKYLRSLAEVENMRKRHEEELRSARITAQEATLREVLPILDDLSRGHKAAQDACGPNGLEQVKEGFTLLSHKAKQTFRKFGVESFNSTNKPFDPSRMEAVAQLPSPSSPGTVLGEIEQGYTIQGKLLRAAKVAVATAAEKPCPVHNADEPHTTIYEMEEINDR